LRDNPFVEERDVVLFDQRGTYYSDPNLVCSESMSLTLQTIEQDLTAEEYARLNEQASLACRDRLAGQGVALAAYNSLENAADVEALRQALDYADINLYGVSYGTLLAQHVVRDHPEHLRSVILDAVVPTDVDFRAEGPRSHDRAFTQLFEACAADPDCAAGFPDLERVFFDLVESLEKNPARVPLTDPETERTYQAAFDGETLIGAVTQLLYSSEILPALPKMIYDARAGHFDLFSRILPLLIFDRTMSEGMYMTTLCAEDADYTLDQVRTDGIRPQLVEDERRDEADFLQLCAKWGVPELGPAVDAAVVSDIPTLIYSGRFDPVTPPAFGERVAQSLPRSTFITWPAGSHGELLSNACTAGVAAAFLRDPLAAPDTSCVQEHSRVDFVTPAQVVMTRAAPNILALLEGRGDPGPVVAYVLGALFLLSLFVVWPLAWVIRILREKPGDRRLGAKAPRWMAVVSALLLLAFGVGLPGAVLASSLQGDNLALFFGLPAAWAWLFALSLAAFALGVALAFFAGVAWVRRYWSAAGRVYYTLLALAAVVCAAALIQLDAAFPLIRRALGLQ